MTLFEQIAGDNRRKVLVLPGGASYSKGDLESWGNSPGTMAWLDALFGKNVGISAGDNTLLALLLLFLDGTAKRLTLLPPGLDSGSFAKIASLAQIEIMVSDRTDTDFAEIPLAPAFPVISDCNSIGTRKLGAINTEWLLPTSGTTRTPKLVAHSVETLTRSVKRNPGTGSELVWGLLYDLNRFAGLQVYLQALLGGSTLVIPQTDGGIDGMLDAFTGNGCNALSATPTLWRKLLMTPGFCELPLRQITLGGEIADQSILSALAASFPEARIRHIYASTEAGVGFSVADGREGFPASYLSTPPPGIELRISSGGILGIRPAISGQRYVGESDDLADGEGFVNTGDRVVVESERVFFQGRDSGAINVGGNKVQPEKVENILLMNPSVALATVSTKRSGITGALVEARIVLHTDPAHRATPVSEIRDWCAARLERYEVPAIIRIVDDLPLTSSGKISRE